SSLTEPLALAERHWKCFCGRRRRAESGIELIVDESQTHRREQSHAAGLPLFFAGAHSWGDVAPTTTGKSVVSGPSPGTSRSSKSTALTASSIAALNSDKRCCIGLTTRERCE